jgi:type I restriction enzyme S subunit
MSSVLQPIPPAWTWCTLGDVVEFLDNRRVPVNEDDRKNRIAGKSQSELFPYYGANGQVGWIDDYLFDEPLILLAEDGGFFETVGKVAYRIAGRTWVNNHAHVLRTFGGIDMQYVHLALNSMSLMPFVSGTTRLKLTQGSAQRVPIPLAPEEEQKRIATKVEEVFQQAKATRLALQKAPPLLKRFRSAVLAKAFRGELTERDPDDEPAEVILRGIEQQKKAERESESKKQPSRNTDDVKPRFSVMREELGKIPEGWAWTTLSRLAEIKGGVTKGRRFSGRRTVKAPYLRVANVQSGYLDLNTVKEIDVLPEEVNEYQLKSGDILFTEGGDRDKLGRGTVWHDEVPRCIHQNHIFRARLKTKDVLPEYISFISQSLFGRDYFSSVASQTVNLASINITNLRSFPIPLAPFGEQYRIVKKIGQILAHVDRVEESVKAGLNSTETVEQSTLAKAFHGELVPQDPNDEPASVLLDRIRAQRAVMGKKAVRRKLEEFASPAAITAKAAN